MSMLPQILSSLINVPGVVGVFIISKDGFVIDKATSSVLNIDDDVLAAMITTAYGSVIQPGAELHIGEPEIVTMEYSNHYVLIVDAGEYILALLADRGRAILGRLRYELRRQAESIRMAART
ncbi:roadblock/LC7 domain-containing protein [Hyperthermus butylicus]|uniref:Conserved archaeal protein n=1 Tax=Hyperthermus butylicus (strain DSM 5456 / JCM 9403 / PLM1-5) TaxID=415426 RepID=A2BJ86_HYPBU|nr:roadblock/LC7 domain-containing protein [Hyperthermus butylicus]ABM80047.1 conserved archaeal protein [Hyperthermus butylicus DSM 5456]